jgi:hypothetical protein
VKPIEVFDTPVDEFGIPDGHRLLALVAQTMDPSYQWPPGTNVHHLVYPRLSYTDELEHQFRERPSLKFSQPIQSHNLAHTMTRPPSKPSREVMHWGIMEERQVRILARQGQLAIRFAEWRDVLCQAIERNETSIRDMGELAVYYARMSVHYESVFHRYLDHCHDSEVNFMPDREMLATMSMREATDELLHLSPPNEIDARDEAQELVWQKLAA